MAAPQSGEKEPNSIRKLYQSMSEMLRLPQMERFVFPALLVVFAFLGVNQGADLTDTTYSLGNYEQFGQLKGDWIYATYLANLCGHLMLKISGGQLLRMNVLTRLLPLATSLSVYFVFKKHISPVILFLGEVIALGLCWCPTVILYNYLSYLLFVAAGLLLWRWSETEQRKNLFLAGVVLGIAVLVRISNLVYCIWILFVCCHLAENRHSFKEIAKATGLCIGGYICGVAAAFLLLLGSEASVGGIQGAVRGVTGMFGWVGSLFTSQAGDAGGYSMGGMLKSIVGGYLFGAKWFLPMLVGILLGTLMFHIQKKKFVAVKTLLYLCGAALLFVWYYRNGVFTANYHNNGAFYGIGTILLWILLLLFVYVASPFCHKMLLRKEKELALFALLVLLAAPLGSNNHLYAVLNQLFLTVPIGIYLLGRWIQAQERKSRYLPLRYMFHAFIALFLVQSVLFGSIYVFKDGEDGSSRDAVITENVVLRGMHTSAAHQQAIEGITAQLQQAPEKTMLTYGNLPGLHYALGLSPALSTLWPDLDSYAITDMEKELESLQEQDFWIVTAAKMPDYTGDMQKKYSLLQDFIYNNGYEIEYRNEEFIVYGKE